MGSISGFACFAPEMRLNMRITRLENGFRKCTKVYIDDEYAFPLYPQDLRQYGIEEGIELTQEQYEELLYETVVRRAKQKCMNLLKKMDRTEAELRRKLRESGYTDTVVGLAVDYVDSYHYIDDARYANHYINYKKTSKSLRQMKMELWKKGVDEQMIQEVLEKQNVTDDEALQRAIRKKTDSVELLSFQEKQKLAASLFRKGFAESDIRKYIRF